VIFLKKNLKQQNNNPLGGQIRWEKSVPQRILVFINSISRAVK